MSSLYDDVKAFADRARAIMVARLAALKNKDQKSRLQGISENGELIARADGESRAAHTLGNTQPAPNENLYLDGTNTLDLKTKKPAKSFVRTRKKKPLELARIVDTPGKFLITSRIGPSGSSNVIIAIIDEGGEPTIPIKVGSYMVSYGYGKNSGSTFSFAVVTDPNVTGSASSYDTSSTASNMSNGTGKGLFWAAKAYAECSHSQVFPVTAYANASVTSSVGVNASASTVGSSGSYTDSDGPNYGSGFLGGNTVITAEVEGEFVSPNFPGGYDASWQVDYEIVRNAEWYYEFSTTDGIYERSFDADDFVSGSIVYMDCLHDYTVKEGNDYYAYAIFHVATATTGESVINSVHYACPVSHYVLHTRVNLSNGQVSNKVNNVNNRSGSESYNWLFTNVFGYKPSTTVDREDLYDKVFEHCYEGDWIYPWRNVRVTGESSTTIDRVRLALLEVSYKETYYWNYADSPMTDDAVNDDIYRWDAIGSSEENNSPANPTAGQFAALYIEMTSSLNSLGDINDYFGVTGPAGSPRDYADWRTWNYYYSGPNFTSNITELFSISSTFLPTSSMGRPFFHYMPRTISSQVQLVGYLVEDVVVSQSQTVRVLYIFTSDAADFLIGDSVSITGSNVIDGSWTVYSQPEPESKTKFGLSPAASLDLTSFTSLSGTVTRT